jgi:hypothetical protein
VYGCILGPRKASEKTLKEIYSEKSMCNIDAQHIFKFC